MSPTVPPSDPRTALELAKILVELVRREGGVIWKDRALALLSSQEKVTAAAARRALIATQSGIEGIQLEYAFGNESWYPATLRLPEESRTKPSGSSGNTVEVPQDLLERCLHYAQTDQANLIDAQRLKRLLEAD